MLAKAMAVGLAARSPYSFAVYGVIMYGGHLDDPKRLTSVFSQKENLR